MRDALLWFAFVAATVSCALASAWLIAGCVSDYRPPHDLGADELGGEGGGDRRRGRADRARGRPPARDRRTGSGRDPLALRDAPMSRAGLSRVSRWCLEAKTRAPSASRGAGGSASAVLRGSFGQPHAPAHACGCTPAHTHRSLKRPAKYRGEEGDRMGVGARALDMTSVSDPRSTAAIRSNGQPCGFAARYMTFASCREFLSQRHILSHRHQRVEKVGAES